MFPIRRSLFWLFTWLFLCHHFLWKLLQGIGVCLHSNLSAIGNLISLLVNFDSAKIKSALAKAFLAHNDLTHMWTPFSDIGLKTLTGSVLTWTGSKCSILCPSPIWPISVINYPNWPYEGCMRRKDVLLWPLSSSAFGALRALIHGLAFHSMTTGLVWWQQIHPDYGWV